VGQKTISRTYTHFVVVVVVAVAVVVAVVVVVVEHTHARYNIMTCVENNTGTTTRKAVHPSLYTHTHTHTRMRLRTLLFRLDIDFAGAIIYKMLFAARPRRGVFKTSASVGVTHICSDFRATTGAREKGLANTKRITAEKALALHPRTTITI